MKYKLLLRISISIFSRSLYQYHTRSVHVHDILDPAHILQQIHKQYIESIPYEMVGLEDAILGCTSWSTSMVRYPVITQHVNLEEGASVKTANGSTFDINSWDPVKINPFPWSLGLGAFPTKARCVNLELAETEILRPAMVKNIIKDLSAILAEIS